MRKHIITIIIAVFLPSPSVLSYKAIHDYDAYKTKYKWMNKQIYARVIEECVRAKENPKLFFAIINAESNGKRTAKSKAGALGYLQVMPANYRGDKADLLNARINIRTGIRVFKSWNRYAKGNLVLALNYYQRGFIPGANIKYIAQITNDYWR